jgi:hypothetical protein
VLFCLILSSCNNDNKLIIGIPQQKAFKVGETTYDIITGSDSCEYYPMQVGAGGYFCHIQYFHYPQCSYCKKNNYTRNK